MRVRHNDIQKTTESNKIDFQSLVLFNTHTTYHQQAQIFMVWIISSSKDVLGVLQSCWCLWSVSRWIIKCLSPYKTSWINIFEIRVDHFDRGHYSNQDVLSWWIIMVWTRYLNSGDLLDRWNCKLTGCKYTYHSGLVDFNKLYL